MAIGNAAHSENSNETNIPYIYGNGLNASTVSNYVTGLTDKYGGMLSSLKIGVAFKNAFLILEYHGWLHNFNKFPKNEIGLQQNALEYINFAKTSFK